MAKKEIVVIGIGRYAATLIEKLKTIPSYSIVAIDSDEKKIENIMGVKNLIVGDATNEEFIKGIGIENADFYVIGMGSDFQTSSIIAANIKENFKGTVIAKSVNPQHEMILRKMGVDDVITPEVVAAKKTFNKIANPLIFKHGNNYEMSEISEGVSIARIPALHKWIEKYVKDIEIPKGIGISLIFKKGKGKVVSGDTKIEKNDILAIVGEDKILINFLEKINKTL